MVSKNRFDGQLDGHFKGIWQQSIFDDTRDVKIYRTLWWFCPKNMIITIIVIIIFIIIIIIISIIINIISIIVIII